MVVTITRDGFIKRTHAGDVPRAEPRRPRPHRRRRRAATTSSPAASMRIRINGCCSSPPAARRSARRSGACRRPGRPRRAGRWSTCCRSSASDTITTVLPLPQDETLWDSLHLVFATASGQRAAQPAVGFPQRARRRPDRDEARRGRPADRRRHLPRGRRRAAGDPARAAASASRSPTTRCACSPAATVPACAASSC